MTTSTEIAKSIRSRSPDGSFVLTDQEAAKMVELFAKVAVAQREVEIAAKPLVTIPLPGSFPFTKADTQP